MLNNESTKDGAKRLAKGLMVLIGVWLGGFNEFPLGQYDARPDDEQREGCEGVAV